MQSAAAPAAAGGVGVFREKTRFLAEFDQSTELTTRGLEILLTLRLTTPPFNREPFERSHDGRKAEQAEAQDRNSG